MPRLPGREKAMFEHRTEEAVQAYCRIVHPNQMNALKDIKCWDSYATRGIAEAEQMIETLKEYRKTLYNRAQQLESTPYTRVLELKRQVDYFSNKKFYYVTIRRVYNGNVARIDEMQEKYPGTERHKAFQRFAELRKANPGIDTIQDTEKGKWER